MAPIKLYLILSYHSIKLVLIIVIKLIQDEAVQIQIQYAILSPTAKDYLCGLVFYQPQAAWSYDGSRPSFPWDLLLPFFVFDLSTTKTSPQTTQTTQTNNLRNFKQF